MSMSSNRPKALEARDNSSISGEDVHHWVHSGKRSPRLEGTGVPIKFFPFRIERGVLNGIGRTQNTVDSMQIGNLSNQLPTSGHLERQRTVEG